MADAAALDGERPEIMVDERSVFFRQYQFGGRNSLVFGELCSLNGLNSRGIRGSSLDENEDDIGVAGGEIAAYLSTRPEDEIKGVLVPTLKQFFPALSDIRLKKKR